ncbi:MAG: hypothetical protein AAFY99_08020 [Pseudomonadota bacterium]
MNASADFYLMVSLNFAMTAAMCLFGILVFWHLQRIRKPGMARIFWILSFGYSLAVLWRVIAVAIAEPSFFRFSLGLIAVGILAAYFAAVSSNPLPPKRYAYEDEDDEPV